MEIILRKDIENLGFKDDVLTVKNGYGRNYLIPQGFAVLATDSAKKQLEETLKQRAHKEAKLIQEASKKAEEFKTLAIKLLSKAGKTGKLFGSVTSIDLAEELSKCGHLIDKKLIQISGGAVKSVGKYQAKVRLHRDVIAALDFEVAAIIEETTNKQANTKKPAKQEDNQKDVSEENMAAN